ncbi:Type-1 restriction enzyme EcoKI specificity protein [Acinetobacter oleivorans]|nr:Type-1 restriction enzyme EcoKI specificity protein [Acinetobacter oleivorans]CAI3100239.1 Type-1 restriction enzyme EcoKI specificity protein [Acinetobacter oleivorans]CAI3118246.1 Type-1 restriction enzyme EcoKI specificity protein [Acinetobacter oleivorans]CAI3118287.1 Type-1 restriction enzyme EcoKI specificity protein [Acinetobacter oleivorans]CAI3118349.1 Type-1 restriction enzyme EcoKI specificity protein [Acinetobacter oleivorans]
MSQLLRYESYKDSGVQWLGEIPSHWNTMAVRRILKEHRQGYYTNEPYIEDGVKLARITDIQSTSEMGLDNSPCVENKVELKEFFLQENDFLFARTGGAGSFGIVRQKDLPAVYASYLIRFRFKENVEAEYLKFFFKSSYFLNSLVANIHGGVNQNIHAEDIKSTFLALPPIEEQKEIANFLNAKIEKVNILIAKQEILLEKLAEQRVALISHAVTKGLNPDVEMKESANTWLGKIPQTWVLKPTKYFLSYVGSGKTPKGGAEVYIDEGIIMIRSQNVYDDRLRLEDVVHITDEADQGQINTRVHEDDVLLNITGASLGRVSIVPKGIPLANVNQHVCILRPIQDLILPEFLHLIMQSHYAKSLIKSEENGTSREGLTFEQIKAMIFALPSLDEQKEICEYIKAELGIINNSKNACNNLIDKLKEYRSTLITQVVTGKIDVRNLKVN